MSQVPASPPFKLQQLFHPLGMTRSLDGGLGWILTLVLPYAVVQGLLDSRWMEARGGLPHPWMIGLLLCAGFVCYFIILLRLKEIRRSKLATFSPREFEAWRARMEARSVMIAVPVGVALAAGSQILGHHAPVSVLFLVLFPVMILGSIVGREHQSRLENLELLAREQALRAKLAPHFIFNTLNTLHAQIEADPRGAQATTERLAQLFRQAIEVSDSAAIPLKQELGFVEAYLGIEQARLGERLRVRVDIPEELESASVPPLSLQVLVENAVKHGIAPLEGGGEIRIGARQEGKVLVVEVSDPGTGIGFQRGTGTALATLRGRLSKPQDLSLERIDARTVASFRWRQP
ncbi:MAG: histidine kinase [Holophagaceae bacterium]|nr:histidine kinase [Holophagaceae bacterium]